MGHPRNGLAWVLVNTHRSLKRRRKSDRLSEGSISIDTCGRAHILTPLTALQGKKDVQWIEIHTAAFNAMKALMAKDCLLSYPDPNIPYDSTLRPMPVIIKLDL
eukprot:scaffold128677_cov51-Attheya_sp.AAC.3